jgi:serine/threonine protein kinase
MEIAQILKTIPRFYNNFAPIEENCGANINRFLENPETNAQECDLFKSAATEATDETEDKKFVYNKIRYIGEDDLYEYLNENKSFLLETYDYLKYSIGLLQGAGIIHYDFKGNNVMIHDRHHTPIIIDFGLSINVNKLIAGAPAAAAQPPTSPPPTPIDEAKRAFYVYSPTYEVWCFEIHFICYLICARGKIENDVFVNTSYDEPVTKEDLETVRADFQKSSLFKYLDLDKYIAELSYFDKYVSRPAKDVVIDIIRDYWKTWDYYSLAMCYLNAGGLENDAIKGELLKFCSANPELRAAAAAAPAEAPVAPVE